MNNIILNDGQKLAVQEIVDWYFTGTDKEQVFRLFGYAGTGKTTCLKTALSILGMPSHNVATVAPTGKAALVLRQNGHDANTIHKIFYITFKGKGNRFGFRLKPKIPSMIQLIVIDEFGMVGDSFIDDICSFGVPVIALGDPNQLPPIGQNNRYLDIPPNALLTEPMRTDDTTGVLDIADIIRTGGRLRPGRYKSSNVFYSANQIEDILDYDMVICWKNETRRKLNMIIREHMGMTSRYPMRGERVIGLQNNYFYLKDFEDLDIFPANGLGMIMLDDYKNIDEDTIMLKCRPDFIESDDIYFELIVAKCVFDSYHDSSIDVGLHMASNEREDLCYVDFFQAGTCHKLQGQSCGRVLVVDEFPKKPDKLYAQFLYTAVTRARYSVDVVPMITG